MADTGNHCIKRVSLNTSNIDVVAGICGEAGFMDGPLGYNRLREPANLGVARNGDIFFLDKGNSYMRKVTAAGVSTLLLGACKKCKRTISRWRRGEEHRGVQAEPGAVLRGLGGGEGARERPLL